MKKPVATYRLQFRGDMDFAAARAIVPYLAQVGISHLYASPIFTAEPGSTHGYDVTDCNEIDPTLGGRAGFEALYETLEAHGLGIILDIVPNHMAASLSNPWWRDVLKFGSGSPFASHFDIDWSERLTLPVLGKPWREVLDAGEIQLVHDEEGGSLAYFDQRFPLAPGTLPARAGLGRDALHDCELIDRVHELQHWNLMFWKDARTHLSYRRFFEVTGLVGMRVEDEATFDATHRLIFDLADSGLVDGLRVDHIDGLSRPGEYLRRLRERVGPDIYLVVEKIIEGEERLPEWPVEGTTGYEFISAITSAFVDSRGARQLADQLTATTGRQFDILAETRAAKQQMVTANFAGEVERLVRLAESATGISAAPLRRAIRELLIAFPVYRTYADREGISPVDTCVLEQVREQAAQVADPQVVDAVISLIALGGGSEFQTRFQQLSGPIMAKSVEDTLYYRDCRVIALNEVGGGSGDGFEASPERAHYRLAELVDSQPFGMRATATHDTKRGEDARARLYALSEVPDAFASGVRRWSELLGDGPGAETQWMIFQALAGIWPVQAAQDAEALQNLGPRFLPYLEKALREAKQRTSWTEPNEPYEGLVIDFAKRLLDPAQAAFHHDFGSFIDRLHVPGWMNSLAQTTIKLTLPGVPDIYQGTELFDDSLVDPDNRRPVPFDHLVTLDSNAPVLWSNWLDKGAKQRLMTSLLAKRAAASADPGPPFYLPLVATGPAKDHCFAFATRYGDRPVIVATPRLTAQLFDQNGRIAAGAWRDSLLWTQTIGRMHNIVTGTEMTIREPSPLASLFADGPLAVLVSADA